MAQAFDRPHQWELRKNGVPFTSGSLGLGDGYHKDNPFMFSLGSGGSTAVEQIVAANDQIELRILKGSDEFFTAGTFIGMDLSIALVPEPATLALLIGAAFVGAFAGRTRR
jgi:hypothetical protein